MHVHAYPLLQIAVWTPAIDTQASSEEEKVKLMLANLTDPQQRSFIEACCDPIPTNRPKIKALLNHPAVAEVPTLKLLSAKVLVLSSQFCLLLILQYKCY